ncbi:insulinase family protein, partial [Klebsiella pneumoniae]
MTLATRTVTLPGGLQATLVHQPQADRAAALARVAAGSHHEPSRFPGLAHLLEHLLFYGGERYQDDDRLMGWVQRQGGSVNATTLARHSAFFFEVAADALADGVARLQEMLQAPLLLREDIQREVAVIDAEYRLIQQHEPSRREAAVRRPASPPAATPPGGPGRRAKPRPGPTHAASPAAPSLGPAGAPRVAASPAA